MEGQTEREDKRIRGRGKMGKKMGQEERRQRRRRGEEEDM